MPEMVSQLLWAVAPGLIVGVIMAVWNSRQKGRDSAREESEKARVKSETLRISLLLATAHLSYASAMAIKRGNSNGEMEAAFKQYDEAMTKFRKFEREQIAKNTTGYEY